MSNQKIGWGNWLERMFLQFGAGSSVFDRVTKSSWWNVASWTLIVAGIVFWVVLLWVMRDST